MANANDLILLVVLTTSIDEQDIASCYRAGANSYIKKPVDPAGFVQAIECCTHYWLKVVLLPREE